MFKLDEVHENIKLQRGKKKVLLTFNDGVSTAIDSKFNEPVLLEILQKLHNTLLNDVLHFNKPFLLLKERTANGIAKSWTIMRLLEIVKTIKEQAISSMMRTSA